MSIRKESVAASKLVIAAGNGTGRLARMVDMQIPVRPQKGEILVTERTRPYFPLASDLIQQTAEGSFLLGSPAPKRPNPRGIWLHWKRFTV